jgi:2-isopropylmalate synthase
VQHDVISKYRAFPQVDLPDRQWPSRVIDRAPTWCSVDLRDGNQALVNPMTLDQKLRMFALLVDTGFKEIEIGFPSAAEVEFEFTRTLIERGLIPDDVFPQVLTQSRDHLIRRTFAAIEAAPRAIVHLYNSTSELQRRVVFQSDRAGVKRIATEGTALVRELADASSADIVFEYSPESFTGTELDYAVEVCDAVVDIWNPSPERRMILNLPATVELATPNVYADQIEWFLRHVQRRDRIILSLHTHNDRGTAVAATELALLAGAERVEGTLFGNGERTGNVDLVTVALNLYTQGVDPGLQLDNLSRLIEVSDYCTEIPVGVRHPYAGELVFTAFSGSHQDAINKGMSARPKATTNSKSEPPWEVPYLPIDPTDLGRSYEAIIRINSQSGKGGVAYIMESEYGCQLPKTMQPEFGQVVQELSDRVGREIETREIWEEFEREYLRAPGPVAFVDYAISTDADDTSLMTGILVIEHAGERKELTGAGNGPIDALKDALASAGLADFRLTHYSEHALGEGSSATAIAYIQIDYHGGLRRYGVGTHPNIAKASAKAMLSALNRAMTANAAVAAAADAARS